MNKDWYIVTNTENLLHFFNFNLIIDKQGFTGNSYETDAMQSLPEGYIPCFSAKDLSYALSQSKVEDPNLISCLLKIDIDQFKNIKAYGGYVGDSGLVTGEKETNINELVSDKAINCILLPAPLPFNIVKSIILEAHDSKENFQKLYNKKFQATTKKGLFETRKNLFKLKDNIDGELDTGEQWTAEIRKINYSEIFSYGGVLGLLYYQSKNSIHSTDVFNVFSDLKQVSLSSKDIGQQDNKNIEVYSPYLGHLLARNNPNDSIESILSLLIPKLAEAQNHGLVRHIITNLKLEDIPYDYSTKYAILTKSIKERIIEKIDEKGNQSEKGLDDIFHALVVTSYQDDFSFKNFAVVLTMLAALGSIETIIKYYHPDFTEQHYSLHAISAGLVYGIVNLPDEIRQFYDLSTWLSYKMAQFSYFKSGYALEFKEPKRPLLIYGDMIKFKRTKALKTHDFYDWLLKKYYKPSEKLPSSEEHEVPVFLSFYDWLTSNSYKPNPEYQKDINNLVRWERAMPKNYTVENSNIVTNTRPTRETAIVNINLLSNYFFYLNYMSKYQSDSKNSGLFNMNELIDGYN